MFNLQGLQSRRFFCEIRVDEVTDTGCQTVLQASDKADMRVQTVRARTETRECGVHIVKAGVQRRNLRGRKRCCSEAGRRCERNDCSAERHVFRSNRQSRRRISICEEGNTVCQAAIDQVGAIELTFVHNRLNLLNKFTEVVIVCGPGDTVD